MLIGGEEWKADNLEPKSNGGAEILEMPSDEVTALYVGAANYADAAEIVLSSSLAAGRDGLILPTHTLIGLAIELGFKAIYVHRIGDDKELKKVGVRHNLVALRRLSMLAGFQSNLTGLDHVVAVIGSNYAAHEYRYMRPHSSLQFVSGAGLAPTIQSFVDEVACDVGLPLRPR
jgi:hypothetical protein